MCSFVLTPKKKSRRGHRSAKTKTKSFRTISGSYDPDQRSIEANFRIFGAVNIASNTAGTVTLTEIDIAPSNWGARGIAFADLYQKFRIKHMQVSLSLHPGTYNVATVSMYMPGNCTWGMGVYYGPSNTFTAPATLTTFVDFPHFCHANDNRSSLTMKIGSADMRKHTNFKWYQTASTGIDNIELIPLCVEIVNVPYLATTQPATADLFIDLCVEFTGSVDPALIPLQQRRPLAPVKEQKYVVL